MAQLIVAAAGAAIGGALLPGFAFLGITGAGLGWAVGSALGAGLGPSQKVQGPRLNDLKVTGTEYGQPIPYVQGHPRVAGQIWWASAKREIATTTETGGKGGPSIETTTYTYEVDLLIGLTDNVIGGVSRVWSNGKLVWTKLADSGATSALSGKSQTSWRRLSVYPGAADQLPDPVYEAAVGVGSAPAYRGRGTVFIEGLQLGGSGQLPNLTFELYTQGTEDGRDAVFLADFPPPSDGIRSAGGIAFDIPSFNVHLRTEALRVSVYTFSLGTEEPQFQYSYPINNSGLSPAESYNTDESGMFMMREFDTTSPQIAYRYADDGTEYSFTLPYANITVSSAQVFACKSGDDLFIGDGNHGGFAQKKVWRYAATGGLFSVASSTLAHPVRSLCATYDYVYALNATGSTLTSTEVYVLDRETLALVSTIPTPATFSIGRSGEVCSDALGNVYLFDGVQRFWRLDGSAWTLVKQFTSIGFGSNGWGRVGVVGGDAMLLRLEGTSPTDVDLFAVFDSVDLTEPTVREVVDDLLARTGIASGSVDTSALDTITTPVRGLAVSQVAPVRAVLEQLAAAYFFETYLADKLYFVPRGGASAATIAYADLGATDGERVDDPLPIDTTPDEEIPAQVALTYANADGDYNTATEHSDRLLSNLTTTSATQLPLALTAAEAKGIADAMVQDTYASRLGGAVQLDARHLARTPTDVVTLTDDDGSTYRVRLVRRRQQGWRVEFDWVSDDATALASAGLTSGDYTPSLSISLPGPTTLALLDAPILRDADDAPGIYAAAKPVGSTGWPGAKLMTSAAGGDYTEAGTFTSRAIMGTTTVALTSWTGGNVFDESGSVTVDVGAGTLSSATRDAMLDSDANAMMVGAEVIQFRTATLVTTGVYKLTGLLRGRRGTEHAMTGHAVGETVVLLRTAGLLRVTYDAARIGVSATYKAVTLGKTLSSATARSITDSGVALKPFAPRNLRVSKTATATTLTWDRRSRYSYRWPSATALPLGEAAESYDVEVYDGATLVQSGTVATPSFALDGVTEVARLQVGVAHVAASGGALYGYSVGQEGPETCELIGHDAAGIQTTSLALGSRGITAITVGSNYYVAVININESVTPSAVTAQRLYRIDLSAPETIAATYNATTLSDYCYMAHDGTDVWVTEQFSGNLRALNASTLVATGTVHAVGGSPMGITHDSGYLYFYDEASLELVKFQIAGGTETWRVSINVFGVTSIRVVGSLVFVAGYYGDRVGVYATSDGAEQYTYPAYGNPLTGGELFATYDGDVMVALSAVGVGESLLRLSASTGAEVSRQTIPSTLSLAYIDGADVVYLNRWQGTGNDYDAVGYDLIPDLTGFTATVYQVSATVGRGYPATITL